MPKGEASPSPDKSAREPEVEQRIVDPTPLALSNQASSHSLNV